MATPKPPMPFVKRLQDPAIWKRNVPGWLESLLLLLAEIESSGTLTVLPHAVPLIEDENPEVAAAASRAIIGVLSRLTPADLAALDSIMRGSSSYHASYQTAWYQLTPETLVRQLDSGGLRADLLGLVSMHPSGYVREAAVQRLAESKDGSEVPYLLVRINDWVAPVRGSARAALEIRLTPEYARHFVRSLALVTRLTDCGRDDHASFVALILSWLSEPEMRFALMEGLVSGDRAGRQTCFRLVIEASDIQSAELLGSVARHDDPVLRLWAAREARVKLSLEDYLSFIEIAAGDWFMPVRREILSGLVERSPDRAGPALIASLLDPHLSVREVARFYLDKARDFDSGSFYRELIRDCNPALQATVIAGLGETGRPDDARLVVPWLSDPVTKVRRAAVRALGRLDGDARISELLHALEDDRLSVGRQAREALRTRLSRVGGERLWMLFERNHRIHVRRYVLTLLEGLGKWAALPYLIRASADPDPESAAQAYVLLWNWIGRFNRTFLAPSSLDIRLALTALDASQAILEPETEARLRFYLKGW